MTSAVRIVHITDSHHRVGHPQLARAVETINSLDRPVDLVVHGGDVINGYAEPDEMHRQAAEASEILSRLTAPLMVTCCNHDTHGEPVRGTIFAEHFHDRWVQEFRKDGVYVLAISGNVDDPTGLELTDDEREDRPYRIGRPWSVRLLRQRLSSQDGLPKLVFTHKPVVPLRGELIPEDPEGKSVSFDFSKYAHKPAPREQLMRVFRECGVVAHYAGHVHLNAHVEEGGLHYVATSATQSFPGEVRLIEVFEDRIEHHMIEVPGGPDLWVRWRNATDRDHPTVREFYYGNPDERDFTIRL